MQSRIQVSVPLAFTWKSIEVGHILGSVSALESGIDLSIPKKVFSQRLCKLCREHIPTCCAWTQYWRMYFEGSNNRVDTIVELPHAPRQCHDQLSHNEMNSQIHRAQRTSYHTPNIGSPPPKITETSARSPASMSLSYWTQLLIRSQV